MDRLDLLLKLVKAEDEESVEKIITSHPILSKDENWKPLGGEQGKNGDVCFSKLPYCFF